MDDPSVRFIRTKIDQLHDEKQAPALSSSDLKDNRSLVINSIGAAKHRAFMDQLSKSGRSLAEIQVAWHEYYARLSDKEKHEVWQEFYRDHDKRKQPSTAELQEQKASAAKLDALNKRLKHPRRSRAKAHGHSLLFGLGMGAFVIFILLFSFFNERFITPFIRPSHNVSASSIIVDPNQATSAGPEPKIIIPKINIEAPVVYDEPSVDEKAIQKALERGVVHYAVTPNPGEKGNSVIVGHSSSNILNSGKFKFAFLLLKSLENGDTFIVHKDGKRYVYKVFNKFVTSPKDVSVLNDTGHPATMTLITCDPPGLSTNRLIIQADQIFPDPSGNTASTVKPGSAKKPNELGGAAPSLWQRLQDWLTN